MSPQAILFPLPLLVPEQEHLTGYISTVMGPVEFRVWKSQLERINEILAQGGVEEVMDHPGRRWRGFLKR